MAQGLLETVTRAMESGGGDLRAWGLAWARVTPTVTLVPAFGLKGVPGPVRLALGLGLALCIAPALAGRPSTGSWAQQLLAESLRGLPVAVGAATGLWLATMVGGLVDDLRGSRGSVAMPVLPSGTTPTGVLLGLLVAVLFLESGGPARALTALLRVEHEQGLLPRVVAQLVGSLELAVAIGAPLLVASLLLEVSGALVARAASPSHIQPLLAPLRSLGLLAILAVMLERLLAALGPFAVGGF